MGVGRPCCAKQRQGVSLIHIHSGHLSFFQTCLDISQHLHIFRFFESFLGLGYSKGRWGVPMAKKCHICMRRSSVAKKRPRCHPRPHPHPYPHNLLPLPVHLPLYPYLFTLTHTFLPLYSKCGDPSSECGDRWEKGMDSKMRGSPLLK